MHHSGCGRTQPWMGDSAWVRNNRGWGQSWSSLTLRFTVSDHTFAAIHISISPSHFSTISLFYFLRCGHTSEDLELVKSDVRLQARFFILHLVPSLNMIVSSVIHCKAHDAIFFKHLRWYFIVYEYHTICVSDVGYLGLSFSSNCYQNSSKHSRVSMCVIRFRFLWVYVKDWYSWLIL